MSAQSAKEDAKWLVEQLGEKWAMRARPQSPAHEVYFTERRDLRPVFVVSELDAWWQVEMPSGAVGSGRTPREALDSALGRLLVDRDIIHSMRERWPLKVRP